MGRASKAVDVSKAEGNGTVAPDGDSAFLAVPKASAASRFAEMRDRAETLQWDPEALRDFLRDLIDALE